MTASASALVVKAIRAGLTLRQEVDSIFPYWVLSDRRGYPLAQGSLETIALNPRLKRTILNNDLDDLL